MLEGIIFIICAGIFALFAVQFSSRSAKNKHQIHHDRLTSELRSLAQTQQNRPEPLAEADAANQTQHTVQPKPVSAKALVTEAPDEIYLMNANIANITTGAAFPDFARQKYATGSWPIPNDAQMQRLVAKIDALAQKAAAYRQTAPIAVTRKARSNGDVTAGGTSWLGGRPRLGETAWPRASNGVPMHHWASISLTDLTHLEAPDDLPADGWLAFFAHTIDHPYEGQVLRIKDAHPQTPPPDDLPIIDHEATFMYEGADYAKEDAPTEHPHWDVEFLQLPLGSGNEGYAKAKAVLSEAFPYTTRFTLATQNLC